MTTKNPNDRSREHYERWKLEKAERERTEAIRYRLYWRNGSDVRHAGCYRDVSALRLQSLRGELERLGFMVRVETEK